MAPAEPKADLGILMVHGIGEQRRSSTLVQWGDPLIEHLRQILPPGDDGAERVLLGDAQLLRSEPGPAHVRATINPADEQRGRTLVMAESWWAADFEKPGFRDVATWGFAIGPWIVKRHLALRVALDVRAASLPSQSRLRELMDGAARLEPREGESRLMVHFVRLAASISRRMASVPMFVDQATIGMWASAVGLVLGAVFQLLLAAILILGILPPTRRLAVGLQSRLSAVLGDTYILRASPIKAAAVVSQVRADLDWLRRKSQQIVVIAHSQGAVIAAEALGGPAAGPSREGVAAFVTLGAAIRKVRVIREAETCQRDLRWGAACGALGGLLLVSVVVLGLTLGPLWIIPTIAGATVALATGRRFDRRVDEAVRAALNDQPNTPEIERIAPDITWLDFYASADPVSEGAALRPVGRPSSSLCIHNRRSTGWDHTSYWRNREQFVTPLGDLLLRRLGLTRQAQTVKSTSGDGGLTAAERRRDADFGALRRRRTVALVVARRCVGGAVLAGIGLLIRGDGSAATVRRGVVAATDWVLGIFSTELAGATSDLLNTRVATAIVAVLVAVIAGGIVYRLLIMPAWLWWQHGVYEAFYARRAPEVWMPRQVLLRTCALIPLAGVMAAAAATSDLSAGGWPLVATATVFVLTAFGAIVALTQPYVRPAPSEQDAHLVRLPGAGPAGEAHKIALPRDGGPALTRGARGVWTIDVRRRAAVLWSPSGETQSAVMDVGGEPLALAAAAGCVWVATTNGICGIDEASLTVRGWIDDLSPAKQVAPVRDSLWILDRDRTAYRLDLVGGRVTRVLNGRFRRVLGDGGVAVGQRTDGRLTIFPDGDGPEIPWSPLQSIMDVCLSDGRIWAYTDGGRLIRGSARDPDDVEMADGGPEAMRVTAVAGAGTSACLASCVFYVRRLGTEIVRADGEWASLGHVVGVGRDLVTTDDAVWILTI